MPFTLISTTTTRILLAEDCAVNRKVALGQLRKLGHVADVAANGFEALTAVERHAYDVVLMDCQMPEMDGYEATAAIRQLRGTRARTWIIAMTACALDGDRELCLAAGMDDYVSKPVAVGDLAAALERAQVAVLQRGEGQTVDAHALTELRALPGEKGESIFEDVIQTFFADAPVLLKKLDEHLAGADARAVTQAAHSLKGSCAQFGAHRLQALCGEIETLGRTARLEPLPALLASARGELDRVTAVLRSELALHAA